MKKYEEDSWGCLWLLLVAFVCALILHTCFIGSREPDKTKSEVVAERAITMLGYSRQAYVTLIKTWGLDSTSNYILDGFGRGKVSLCPTALKKLIIRKVETNPENYEACWAVDVFGDKIYGKFKNKSFSDLFIRKIVTFLKSRGDEKSEDKLYEIAEILNDEDIISYGLQYHIYEERWVLMARRYVAQSPSQIIDMYNYSFWDDRRCMKEFRKFSLVNLVSTPIHEFHELFPSFFSVLVEKIRNDNDYIIVSAFLSDKMNSISYLSLLEAKYSSYKIK